jgi:hypothetical protein
MGNGEVSMLSRGRFINKNFLTQEERKFGNGQNLENINRSFMKLGQLKDRNWS